MLNMISLLEGSSGLYRSDRFTNVKPLLFTILPSVVSASAKSCFHRYTFPNNVSAATLDAFPPAVAKSAGLRYESIFEASFRSLTARSKTESGDDLGTL